MSKKVYPYKPVGIIEIFTKISPLLLQCQGHSHPLSGEILISKSHVGGCNILSITGKPLKPSVNLNQQKKLILKPRNSS